MSYDLSDIVKTVKKAFKNEKISSKVGLATELKELGPEDFVRLGSWWTESTGTYGIPFGRITTLAGNADSGKTSVAIQAMKAALEQGCGVIYAETENKTTEKDMKAWGVDPSQVIIISSTIAEEMYELTLAAWDAFKDKYPEVPILVIIDSIGNLISMRDEDIDMLEQNAMPGGKGKANRLGLSRIVAKMNRDNAAVLLVSYVYDNMGSPGKKTAGGEALHLYSVLMYQTSRKGWLEKTVQGVKQRIGAEVKFTLQKNHLNKDNPGLKEIFFRITKDGIDFVNKAAKAEEDDFDG